MEIEALQAELDLVQKNAAKQSEKLSALQEGCRKDLSNAASEWIIRHVEQVVAQNSTHVEELGIEKLKELKASISGLISSMPAKVEARIPDTAAWPHKASKDSDTTRLKDFFYDVARSVVGGLGDVLSKFGFFNPSADRYPSWTREGEGFRYQINMGFDEQYGSTIPLQTAENIAKYIVEIDGLEQLQELLSHKQGQLSKLRAKLLWDGA